MKRDIVMHFPALFLQFANQLGRSSLISFPSDMGNISLKAAAFYQYEKQFYETQTYNYSDAYCRAATRNCAITRF